MQNILIVGGAGYIGSQTTLALIDAGFHTIIFDSMQGGHENIIPEESKFIKGDLSNQEDLKKLFDENQIDGVIHFAAYIAMGESVENPQKYYRNNVEGTMNLLQAMVEHNVKKIVFSSTAGVYGTPKEVPIKEDFPLNPANPYGWSKRMVEQILEDYYKAYQLNCIRLRYFNACGADTQLRTGEMHEPETHLIPIILQAANGERPFMQINGQDYNTPDGTCIRDYIHTMDLASAHVLALQKLIDNDQICEAINLGTGRGYSNLAIVNKVKEITGKDFEIKFGEKRPGDVDALIADNSKAKLFLGWKPKFSDLETIIKTAWDWKQKMLSSLN